MSADTVKQPVDVLHTVNLVTQCLCIPIITLFVAMRFSIRLWYRQFVGIEDCTSRVNAINRTNANISRALFMGYCAIAIIIGKHGGGYHQSDIHDQATIVSYYKFCYIATVLYCPMALFVKIALLSIIIRIFAPYRTKIIFIYVLLGCLCIYYIIAEIIKIRMCNPIPSYWEGTPGRHCFDQSAALLADSIISVVSDLIILILPLPLTWSLQMSRSKKLRVMGILSAGGLATAFSIYRLILVLRDGKTTDMTIFFICIILSGNAEGGVGLICACLPTLNILIKKLRTAGYSSNRYYEQDSSVHLSQMKGGNNKRFSKGASKSDTYVDATEFGSDQSHLISYAGAVDGESRDTAIGIQKTVDVSQTVEMLDQDGSDHGHPARQSGLQPPFSRSLHTSRKQETRGDDPQSKDGSVTETTPDRGQDVLLTLPTIARTADHHVFLVQDDIQTFLNTDLDLSRVNIIHSLLWMAGRPMNARPLQRQKMMGYEIIPTERADLHLLKFSTRLLVKPLPEYILDHDFWTRHLCSSRTLHESASGLLLSYMWLICTPLDLQLAHDHSLLPKDLTWPWWKSFVTEFYAHVDVNALDTVNKRYQFGELRLGRINTIYRVRFFLSHFIRGYLYGYNRYVVFYERNFAWMLMIFATFSLVLSAMQVAAAVPRLNDSAAFQDTTYGFVVLSIVVVAVFLGVLGTLFSGIYVFNMFAAISQCRRERFKREQLARRRIQGS
ncbi:uncharacterized protein CDV56_107110 [Aspergillus thermomutatus]|uniref:Rhodopsin domain-containing protein n=1 Tax=Aspergillus thermomutatus TaxID=41047 RepID=A0A397H145_ASPTH|nr:uncharacterized protein CDV56_107110 [Aspergillus thermomutatus]RHZ55424.1 hypothetical protein CDV56_107110 [Aspergillus thermomutatus]